MNGLKLRVMSKIEWTEQTWNPIIGCNKLSSGCKNCYAEKMAKRLSEIQATEYYKNVVFRHPLAVNYGKWNGTTHFVESQLDKPLKRKRPTMYFVCSMGDMFHESVPFEWIDAIFSIMSDCDNHTYQILTKRPKRISDFFQWKWKQCGKLNNDDFIPWYPKDNIWFGVTAENQEMANKRIPILLKIPVKIRFISVEPMLEEVDLTELGLPSDKFGFINSLYGTAFNSKIGGHKTKSKIDWVIYGGESGHNARPMHPDWVRSLRDQCKAANVPFFFKQWGKWYEKTESKIFGNTLIPKFGIEKNICLLDGIQHKEFPKCTK